MISSRVGTGISNPFGVVCVGSGAVVPPSSSQSVCCSSCFLSVTHGRLLRMADPFDSAWLKWGRAVLHAHDLFDEINALQLTEENFCKTRTQYEPKRHCLSLRVDWIADPPPILSVKLGDVVHNYRSCLDHIAWALVGRGKTPPPLIDDFEQAGVYFPICSTRDEFNTCLEPVIKKGRIVRRAKLPGVRLADSAIVRRYQPYQRGSGTSRCTRSRSLRRCPTETSTERSGRFSSFRRAAWS